MNTSEIINRYCKEFCVGGCNILCKDMSTVAELIDELIDSAPGASTPNTGYLDLCKKIDNWKKASKSQIKGS